MPVRDWCSFYYPDISRDSVSLSRWHREGRQWAPLKTLEIITLNQTTHVYYWLNIIYSDSSPYSLGHISPANKCLVWIILRNAAAVSPRFLDMRIISLAFKPWHYAPDSPPFRLKQLFADYRSCKNQTYAPRVRRDGAEVNSRGRRSKYNNELVGKQSRINYTSYFGRFILHYFNYQYAGWLRRTYFTAERGTLGKRLRLPTLCDLHLWAEDENALRD